MEIIAVPAIVSLVFSIMQGYKKLAEKSKHHEDLIRIIPVVAGILGIIAGLICYYAIPGIILADNIIKAMMIGGASGLSATGCNQIFKQLHKFGINIIPKNEESKDSEENSDESN